MDFPRSGGLSCSTRKAALTPGHSSKAVPRKHEPTRTECQSSGRMGVEKGGTEGSNPSPSSGESRLSPASAFEGREPWPSAWVCPAGLATRSAETRRLFRYCANRRQYLCRAIFQYRSAAEGVGEKAALVPNEVRPSPGFTCGGSSNSDWAQAKPSMVR
jgi:hypothetical protein